MKQNIIDRIRKTMSYDRAKGMPITRILNAEHNLGAFHALMDLLFDIDVDAYVELAKEYEDARKEMLNICEQAYKTGGTTK